MKASAYSQFLNQNRNLSRSPVFFGMPTGLCHHRQKELTLESQIHI